MEKIKKMSYDSLTNSWLNEPTNQEIINELCERFNDESIEKFIMFFFTSLLRKAREITRNEFERPLKGLIDCTKQVGLYDLLREILQEIHASNLLTALAKSVFNEYRGHQSTFTWERFLSYMEIVD